MALFNFRGNKQVEAPKPVNVVSSLHRSRVAALEKTWYNTNRQFLNSPNSEIRIQLEKIRDISRLLCTIDAYAVKYLELLSIYVVGQQGMQISPRIEDAEGLDTEINNTIKTAWEDWCEEASFDGRYSFKELESMGIRSLGRDGEAIFRIMRGRDAGKYGFALHPIDPGLLDVNYSGVISENRVVIMGVEYEGVRPIAYHIWNRHADFTYGMLNRERERIDADEIVHIFDDDYGSLVRGMPWMTPALRTLARLHEYTDAHLLASQVAAAAPLVLENQEQQGIAYDDVGVVNRPSTDGTSSNAVNATPQQFINLDFQQILELPVGKKLQALNLQFPQTGFSDAVKQYLMEVSAALMVSYSTLTSDSSAESYSTVRHGSIIERDHWRSVQAWYIQRLHKKVYRAWLDQAMLSGNLELPTENPADYYAVVFQPRGFIWIDPVKDLRAYVEGIKQGIYTRSQIVAELGGNWEDNIKMLAKEQKYAEESGIPLPEIESKVSIAQQVADLESQSTGEEVVIAEPSSE